MNTENLNLFEKYTVSLDSNNENKFVISVENSENKEVKKVRRNR